MNKSHKIKHTFSWVSPLIASEEIKGYGRGMFALDGISKGSIVAIFGGYVMTAKDELSLPEHMRDYALQIHDDFVLGIKKEDEIEEACYFNHSCDANAGIKGQIMLVAMRDIAKGEQVCFDYAMVLAKSEGVETYSFDCQCGAKTCRHKVTDDDWKEKDLQERYEGFFQWYIQEKIDRQR